MSSILEINTKNILKNYNYLSSISKNSIAGATIKANAYGLGDVKIFKLLYKAGCRHFFVATFDEAEKIRKVDRRGYIYILNGLNKNIIKKINIKDKIIPIINSIENYFEFYSYSKKNKKKINIGIHIDTGINRLGLTEENLSKIKSNKYLEIGVILSHLASADEKNNRYNEIQNNKFYKIKYLFKKTKYFSLANSLGIKLGKKFHHDLTRSGISLYGGHYNSAYKKYIKPVIKLKAEVIQIKKILTNEYIGYNQTYKSRKNITIAIIDIGYADGISRKLSNIGYVFFKEYKFRIIGRVSMDSITIDITHKKKLIKNGMFLDIINYSYDIEKMALKCNTISNEILTSISARVKRKYI